MSQRPTIRVRCAVAGCDALARVPRWGGEPYCAKHRYRVQKYGDPLAGRTFSGEPQKYLNEVVLPYESGDCLFWPYARNSAGYGHLVVNGKTTLVHRIACEHRNGPPPFPGAQASHSCGNGHLGCCNPLHQRWDTCAGNFADKARHGTLNDGVDHYLAKLTEDDVRAIRKSTESQTVLAARYGVEQTNISAIKRRKSWKHVA